MGLNFMIYESVKTFAESPFFKRNHTRTSQASDIFVKGLCGGIAGGTSKFLIYPLVSRIKRIFLKRSICSVFVTPNKFTINRTHLRNVCKSKS